ncbi:hypothetical protein L6164_014273 [Bauhinia variegata]|uniref:Uncharacterized protein n=1 Tax=Bauhinia variegata TaxID=167791 RepID=A0ACB9NKE4_BAUVA|nr:hypothetical protein L6164_014273 [Bauhinia variegata]
MASKSPIFCLKLCAVMCMVMLLSSRAVAQVPGLIPRVPPFPAAGRSSQQVHQCWSSLAIIGGCVMEIYGALLRGQFKAISPACCRAITQITGSCWSRLFPFNPYFPPLLKSSCRGTRGNVNVPSLPLINLTFQGPGLLPPGPAKCWRSLASIPGCVLEIYGALYSGKFGSIGPTCCKAITNINNSCWTGMFPMNPLFPPLLTSSCARPPPATAALAPHPPPK